MWLVESTTNIPCSLGEHWGFTFELEGLPSDRPVDYRSEMHHPPILQPDGGVLTVSVTRFRIDSGARPLITEAWSFLPGYEFELVPGTWTRKIFVDDVELGAVAFQVDGPVELVLGPADPRKLVLGIRYQSVAGDSAAGENPTGGARVVGVFAGTPAERIGLRPGDVITRCLDSPIRSAADLHAVLDENAGRLVRLAVIRGPQQLDLTVELWKR